MLTNEESIRFANLLDRAEKPKGHGLTADDVWEIGNLYRRHTAHLARLRARADDPEAIRYHNGLCVRGYTLLYQGNEVVSGVRDSRGLARLIGQTWRAQVAAWLLLLFGMVVGAALVAGDPNAMHALIPGGMGYGAADLERLATSEQARADFLEHIGRPLAERAVFGSMLFAHNTQVGLLSFAVGMLAGVPTVLLQLYNGLVLGAFFGLFVGTPSTVAFLAWILPHGVPELTAISLCAAGGLLLGRALAAPGRDGHRVALRRAVPPAMALVLCSLPLFVVAAFVESFVRESGLGLVPRFLVAAIGLAIVGAAMAFARRASRAESDGADWLAELVSRTRSAAPGSD